MVLSGEGCSVAAYSVLTVEEESLPFSAKEDNGHWSSMIPRARHTGVPRTTPSSPWIM